MSCSADALRVVPSRASRRSPRLERLARLRAQEPRLTPAAASARRIEEREQARAPAAARAHRRLDAEGWLWRRASIHGREVFAHKDIVNGVNQVDDAVG